MYTNSLTHNTNFVFESVLTNYYDMHDLKLEPWSTAIKVYNTTGSHLDTIPYNGTNVKALWANDNYLYIGTTDSGIDRLAMSYISSPSISGSDLFNYIESYKQHPSITSNHINYLHGNANYLCASTNSGVDHINITTDDWSHSTFNAGREGYKCYQTPDGRFYYIDGTTTPLVKGMVATTDHTKVDETLYNFPICLTLSSGIINPLFIDGLTDSDWEYLHVRVDGVDCYVEVDQFDLSIPNIVLWAKIPEISATEDMEIEIIFITSSVNSYIGLTGSTAAQNVWDDNFLAVYHMSQDPTGGTGCVLDSTSNSNNGTPAGTLTQVDVGSSKGYYFSGGQYITSINNAGVYGNAARTTESYAASYVSSYSSSRCTVALGGTSASTHTWFFLAVHTSGRWFINTYYDDLYSSVYPSQYQYYHSSARWSPTTESIQVDTTKNTRTISSLNTTHNKIRIGNTTYSTNHYRWIGVISEVRVSNVARSDAWLRATNYTLRDELCSYRTNEFSIIENLGFNVVYNNTSNWDESTVGYKYETSGDFLPLSFVPYDIDISENKSLYNPNDNVIFLATDIGVLIIEERQGNELNSRIKYYLKED